MTNPNQLANIKHFFTTFAAMNYNTLTLPNGLRIIHLPSASPVVYCGYQIQAGSRNELPGEEGLAHFCEHVTFKGTARRRAWHILNNLESVGGDLQAYTTKESTVYYAAILHEHVARAVDLLSDMVFHSVYPQAEIDKEVEVICDEIESYNDSPTELIYDEFENLLFKGHPLGHSILGNASQVRRFTTADALRFTQQHYRPSNAIFFAYGDISFTKLVRLLQKAQDTIAPDQEASTPQAQPIIPEGSATGVHIVDKHTHQSHVMIGARAYDVHDPRRMPLYLLNNILGGPGMNAKLNLALREHHGLVYTVESNLTAYSDLGYWSIYFGCDAHDVQRCRNLVRKVLQQFVVHPLTPTQLRAAKKQIKGQIGVACDNRENFALDFGKSYLHDGWQKSIPHLYEQIDAITSQQIQDVARELFSDDHLVTLIYQ